jgi:gamma-glutamyl hydrolase
MKFVLNSLVLAISSGQ